MWEKGIELCKELANQYEHENFDYIQLSQILVSRGWGLLKLGLFISTFRAIPILQKYVLGSFESCLCLTGAIAAELL